DLYGENMEKCQILPSRNCHMLRLWLSYREREVYPKMPGYTAPPKKRAMAVQTSMVKMTFEKLPVPMRFTKYAISGIPLGALAKMKTGMLPGQLCQIPPGFSDNAMVYGLVVLSERADYICSIYKNEDISAIRIDLDNNELLI
ncbi:unnamed protein product, partial [Polarella glacialis]